MFHYQRIGVVNGPRESIRLNFQGFYNYERFLKDLNDWEGIKGAPNTE
jgi:hypothetical protein